MVYVVYPQSLRTRRLVKVNSKVDPTVYNLLVLI